jgi:hypothetical protein
MIEPAPARPPRKPAAVSAGRCASRPAFAAEIEVEDEITQRRHLGGEPSIVGF